MPKFSLPRLFLGSSVEGLPIANAIIRNLEHVVYGNSWTNAFPLSQGTIDSLLAELQRNDFAAFVLSADDITKMRGTDYATSRDNVLFEVGLAMGKYEKSRCFLIVPRDVPGFHIPSDLLGFTTATYLSERAADDPLNALNSASGDISGSIFKSEWSNIKLDVFSYIDQHSPEGLFFKNKVLLKFSNRENYSVKIELKDVKLKKHLIDAADSNYGKRNIYRPKFIYQFASGEEHYSYERILKPGEQKSIWIPIDPQVSRLDVEEIIKKDALGTLQVSIELLNNSDRRINKSLEF